MRINEVCSACQQTETQCQHKPPQVLESRLNKSAWLLETGIPMQPSGGLSVTWRMTCRTQAHGRAYKKYMMQIALRVRPVLGESLPKYWRPASTIKNNVTKLQTTPNLKTIWKPMAIAPEAKVMIGYRRPRMPRYHVHTGDKLATCNPQQTRGPACWYQSVRVWYLKTMEKQSTKPRLKSCFEKWLVCYRHDIFNFIWFDMCANVLTVVWLLAAHVKRYYLWCFQACCYPDIL